LDIGRRKTMKSRHLQKNASPAPLAGPSNQ
jgi:hypothetical protein